MEFWYKWSKNHINEDLSKTGVKICSMFSQSNREKLNIFVVIHMKQQMNFKFSL